MSAEPEKDSQLEIAHVLFTDIVGYSKLPIDQQSELLRQLNPVVRGTEHRRGLPGERSGEKAAIDP